MKNKYKPIYLSQKDEIKYTVVQIIFFVFLYIPGMVYLLIRERNSFDFVLISSILIGAYTVYSTISFIRDFRRILSFPDWKFVIDQTGIYYNDKEGEFYVKWMYQYYVKNLKTLWHTATYVYNSPLRCTLQHLADDIENS